MNSKRQSRTASGRPANRKSHRRSAGRSRKGYDIDSYVQRFLRADDLGGVEDYTWNPESAMRISAVYACVTIRSQNVASLPLMVYERLADGGQREAPEHPAAQLLARPNPYQTTLEWVQQQVACLDLRGNGISLKVRRDGEVVELVPVHPSRVMMEQHGPAVIYRITDNQGRQMPVLSEDVLHIPGLATDGYWGLSPIAAASDAISLARKIQRYGISVFDSGGAKRVLLKFPEAMSDDAIENIRRSWEQIGKDSAKTVVLEQGGDATTIGMNADEAQFLETRQMSVADIARIYTMPLMLLGVHDKTSSYASTEQFDLLFGKYTIRPICKRIEARIDRSLIADPRFFCKFNMDALLRGDVKTRTDALAAQFERGALTLNEWRELENRNPMAGEGGDVHFVPVNLAPVERALEGPAAESPGEEQAPADEMGGLGGNDNRERASLEPFVKDIAGRILGKEIREMPTADRSPDFLGRHEVYIFKTLRPLFDGAGITDDDRREQLAKALVAGCVPGTEIDVQHRESEIYCTLMGAVESNAIRSFRWHAAAAAARRDMAEAAASADKPRSPDGQS